MNMAERTPDNRGPQAIAVGTSKELQFVQTIATAKSKCHEPLEEEHCCGHAGMTAAPWTAGLRRSRS